jgi:hypothetical protein
VLLGDRITAANTRLRKIKETGTKEDDAHGIPCVAYFAAVGLLLLLLLLLSSSS